MNRGQREKARARAGVRKSGESKTKKEYVERKIDERRER